MEGNGVNAEAAESAEFTETEAEDGETPGHEMGGGQWAMKKEAFTIPHHMREFQKKGVAGGALQKRLNGKSIGDRKLGKGLDLPLLCFCNDMIRWGLEGRSSQ